MSRPDLLLFLSDQHDGRAVGYAGHAAVETPNMDAMAARGCAWDAVSTACPVCVPARATLLTGRLPQRNEVYNNSHTLSSDAATFLHSLAAAGYETVLCGRMHFVGHDQRHGFTQRIHGDITRPFGPIAPELREVFGQTYGMGGPVNLCGAGDSPVLAFDRSVTDTAVAYLERDHDKPQCLVVGTYGPHFPYVAPPPLFEKYLDRADVPASWDAADRDDNPLYDAKRHRQRKATATGRTEPVTPDVVRAARAAYFGMIEEQDRLVGLVRDAWRNRLQRSGRAGVMAYTSDHGDTCGEHGIFGKQTFYEGSVRIPLVLEGEGVAPGRRVAEPASIMDIGPTLCDIAGADAPPAIDGVSVFASARSDRAAGDAAPRVVISEWSQAFRGAYVAGRMVRKGRWKLIRFAHDAVPDRLFDLERDPEELRDAAAAHPEVHEELLAHLRAGWDPEAIAASHLDRDRRRGLIAAAERACPPRSDPGDAWEAPASCLGMPERVV